MAVSPGPRICKLKATHSRAVRDSPQAGFLLTCSFQGTGDWVKKLLVLGAIRMDNCKDQRSDKIFRTPLPASKQHSVGAVTNVWSIHCNHHKPDPVMNT